MNDPWRTDHTFTYDGDRWQYTYNPLTARQLLSRDGETIDIPLTRSLKHVTPLDWLKKYRPCSRKSTSALESVQDSPSLLQLLESNSSDYASETSGATISSASVTPAFTSTPMSPEPSTSGALGPTSSPPPHPVSPSVVRDAGGEPTTIETVSPPSSGRSMSSDPDSSLSRTYPDCSPAPGERENPTGHISGDCWEPFTSAGTMWNGWLYRGEAPAVPSLDKGYSWLPSPGALSSTGVSSPPGQSKLEAFLRKEGILERTEVLNPRFLEKVFGLPLDWTNPSEPRAVMELLATAEPPSVTPSIPESPASPSIVSSTSPEEPVMIPIKSIRRDGGTQPRAAINHQTVVEYCEDMKAGDRFPPVTVFYDGTHYWLADGFHRVEAAFGCGHELIACEVRQGTRRDAVLHSVSANAQHGLRRKSTDKRRAVMTMLEDREWSLWSDRTIARHCRVDNKTVAKYRDTVSGYRRREENLTEDFLSDTETQKFPGNETLHDGEENLTEDFLSDTERDERFYTDRHGNRSRMNVANIGKARGKSQTELEIFRPSQSVTVGGGHARSSQTGEIAGLIDRETARVVFEEGEEEAIFLKYLTPVTEEIKPEGFIREGLNYRVGMGCEWYVRVSQETWNSLLELQARYGTATLDSAIKRMIEEIQGGKVL